MAENVMIIQNHPNYFVTIDGRVGRLYLESKYAKSKIKLLNPFLLNGFYAVDLDGVTCYIHRLVAECFLERDPNRNYIFHIDGDKLNNDAKNLIWVNARERSVCSGWTIEERICNMRNYIQMNLI